MGNLTSKPNMYTPGHPPVGKSTSAVHHPSTQAATNGAITQHTAFKGQNSNPKGNNAVVGTDIAPKGGVGKLKVPMASNKKYTI